MQSYLSFWMATFHANEKPNLIITVDDFSFKQGTKGCLSAMLGSNKDLFTFQRTYCMTKTTK
jgi:hypothetical protein